MRGKELEKDIQRAILEYLKYKRYFAWRNNSGAFMDKENHFYRFGDKGSPDIFLVNDGKFYGLEIKTSKGKQSPAQEEWQKRCEQAGGHYIILRSLSEVTMYFP